MKLVIKYLRPYFSKMSGGLIIKIIGTLMDLVIPYILTYMVDELVPLGNINKIALFGVIMILCSIVGFSGNVIANQLSAKISMQFTTDLRHDLFEKIETLSSNQIDNITMPSLVSRMNNDTYNLHRMVAMSQRIGVRAPILLIGGIIITLTLNVKLTLVLVATLPLIFLVTFFVSKNGVNLYGDIQLAIDSLVRKIRESISGIRVIKALSKEKYEQERFDEVNKNEIDKELKAGYSMSILNPIIMFFLNIGLVGVLVVGAFLVMNEEIKVGKIISFTTYFTIIANAMRIITRIFIQFSQAIASANRIKEVLDEDIELLKEELDEEKSDNIIEFKDVSFSYNGKLDNLTNINFAIKKGESLGIIGATGAGKTTIINLLLRFYDIKKGKILVEGKNIKSYDLHELRSMFGVVFQNDCLFSNSVRDNISFYRDLNDVDINKALDISQASSFVYEDSEGLAKIINAKGTNLSGGQKQRLLIARAVASSPKILILDDSSSALDYATDAKLRKAIKDNKDEVTSIIISSRVSSIMNCEHILVIADGCEVGYGTHDELLRDVKEYHEIYSLQMGGNNE